VKLNDQISIHQTMVAKRKMREIKKADFH